MIQLQVRVHFIALEHDIDHIAGFGIKRPIVGIGLWIDRSFHQVADENRLNSLSTLIDIEFNLVELKRILSRSFGRKRPNADQICACRKHHPDLRVGSVPIVIHLENGLVGSVRQSGSSKEGNKGVELI